MKKKNSAFTLIEVLFSLTILSLLVLFVLFPINAGIQNIKDETLDIERLEFAMNIIETEKAAAFLEESLTLPQHESFDYTINKEEIDGLMVLSVLVFEYENPDNYSEFQVILP